MVSKIPASLTGSTYAPVRLDFSGVERAAILSAMTNYGGSLFFVDGNNKPIYNNDSLDGIVESIIAKLSGDNMVLYGEFWRSVDTVVSNATFTDIVYNSYNTNGDFWTGAEPEKITIYEDGVYVLSTCSRWVSNNVGQRILQIRINDDTVAASRLSAAFNTDNSISVVVPLSAGDVFTAVVHQNSGGDLTMKAYQMSSMYSRIAKI